MGKNMGLLFKPTHNNLDTYCIAQSTMRRTKPMARSAGEHLRIKPMALRHENLSTTHPPTKIAQNQPNPNIHLVAKLKRKPKPMNYRSKSGGDNH